METIQELIIVEGQNSAGVKLSDDGTMLQIGEHSIGIHPWTIRIARRLLEQAGWPIPYQNPSPSDALLRRI
jgi:hypothetical protein